MLHLIRICLAKFSYTNIKKYLCQNAFIKTTFHGYTKKKKKLRHQRKKFVILFSGAIYELVATLDKNPDYILNFSHSVMQYVYRGIYIYLSIFISVTYEYENSPNRFQKTL